MVLDSLILQIALLGGSFSRRLHEFATYTRLNARTKPLQCVSGAVQELQTSDSKPSFMISALGVRVPNKMNPDRSGLHQSQGALKTKEACLLSALPTVSGAERPCINQIATLKAGLWSTDGFQEAMSTKARCAGDLLTRNIRHRVSSNFLETWACTFRSCSPTPPTSQRALNQLESLEAPFNHIFTKIHKHAT